MMKLFYLLAASLQLLSALSQTALAQPKSGIITYEGMHRIDPSEFKIVINGNVVKPGSPDAPPLPEVRTFSQKLIFAGDFAREEKEAPIMLVRRFEGAVGDVPNAPTRHLEAPFTEARYFDLPAKKILRTLEVKKGNTTNIYQADYPFPVAKDLQETSKTRKVAGYTCRKATANWQGETYTIWYTTELPFTYSPIIELMPPQGVVLQIENNNDSFRATRVSFSAISETDVKPALTAQKVSGPELDKFREKALADFRQQTFSGLNSDK